MPAQESLRRLRKLALGAGGESYLADVLEAFERGRMKLYSRPPGFDLMQGRAVETFGAATEGAEFVLVDSGTAGMLSGNPNLAIDVRTFVLGLGDDPARATLVLHHQRKPGAERRGVSFDAKAAVMGSQAWGAAAGDTWRLERGDTPEPDHDGGKHPLAVHLSRLGSWTPDEVSDLTLRAEDDASGAKTRVWVEARDPLELAHEMAREGGQGGVKRQALLRTVVERAGICSEKALDGRLKRAVRRGEFVRAGGKGREVVYYEPGLCPDPPAGDA